MDNESINNIFMQGIVAEVVGSRARVKFEDRDDMLSAPLQVIQMFTGENKSIRMPDLGEKVVCIFLPTGLEDGYIIGSVYIDGNNPPAANNAIQFSDGSTISFSNGTMNINMVSSVNITAPSININGDQVNSGSISASGLVKSDTDVQTGAVSLKGHTNGGYGVDQA